MARHTWEVKNHSPEGVKRLHAAYQHAKDNGADHNDAAAFAGYHHERSAQAGDRVPHAHRFSKLRGGVEGLRKSKNYHNYIKTYSGTVKNPLEGGTQDELNAHAAEVFGFTQHSEGEERPAVKYLRRNEEGQHKNHVYEVNPIPDSHNHYSVLNHTTKQAHRVWLKGAYHHSDPKHKYSSNDHDYGDYENDKKKFSKSSSLEGGTPDELNAHVAESLGFTQHSEVEPGHVTAERANEIVQGHGWKS